MSENSIHLDEHTLHVQTLFVQHQQALLAYVLSLEPDLHDAQEIVQEAFMTASRKASTWTDGTNFLAWVCTIARFNTLHFQRTRSRRSARLAEDIVELLAEHAEEEISVFQNRVKALPANGAPHFLWSCRICSFRFINQAGVRLSLYTLSHFSG